MFIPQKKTKRQRRLRRLFYYFSYQINNEKIFSIWQSYVVSSWELDPIFYFWCWNLQLLRVINSCHVNIIENGKNIMKIIWCFNKTVLPRIMVDCWTLFTTTFCILREEASNDLYGHQICHPFIFCMVPIKSNLWDFAQKSDIESLRDCFEMCENVKNKIFTILVNY